MRNKIIGTSNAGNPIKETVYGKTFIYVGNDGYDLSDAGKYIVQSFSDGQWNEIDGFGLVDNENEAIEAVTSLINEEIYLSENIRWEQI